MNGDDDVLDAAGGAPLPPDGDRREVLTVAEVAKLLNMHVVTVRRLLKSGAIPGKKLGQWRCSRAAILQSLSESSEREPAESSRRLAQPASRGSVRGARSAFNAAACSDILRSRRAESRLASQTAAHGSGAGCDDDQAPARAKSRSELLARDVQSIREPGRYCCGDGLYLQVTPRGSKSWIFRFKQSGRAREMGLGPLDSVSLSDARERASECRGLLAAGIDPIEARGGALRVGVGAGAQVIPIKPRR